MYVLITTEKYQDQNKL